MSGPKQSPGEFCKKEFSLQFYFCKGVLIPERPRVSKGECCSVCRLLLVVAWAGGLRMPFRNLKQTLALSRFCVSIFEATNTNAPTLQLFPQPTGFISSYRLSPPFPVSPPAALCPCPLLFPHRHRITSRPGLFSMLLVQLPRLPAPGAHVFSGCCSLLSACVLRCGFSPNASCARSLAPALLHVSLKPSAPPRSSSSSPPGLFTSYCFAVLDLCEGRR